MIGDYIAFGPTRSTQVDGIALIGKVSEGPIRVNCEGFSMDAVIAEHFADGLQHPSLLAPFTEYLQDKKEVEYMTFKRIWDLRALHIDFNASTVSVYDCIAMRQNSGSACLVF
jgi:hypothetical protein